MPCLAGLQCIAGMPQRSRKLQPTRSKENRLEGEAAATAWILRRDAGPWTPADATAFAAWLAESVGHRAAYFRLNAAWEETGRLQALIRGPSQHFFPAESAQEADPVASVPRGAGGTRWGTRALAIAASLLLAVGAAFFAWQGDLFHGNSYTTAIGGLRDITLSDDSRVILNTNSKLRIVFTPAERRIYLDEGEAFFKVSHDPSRPFVVSAGHSRIVAVGTEFSVRRQLDGTHDD